MFIIIEWKRERENKYHVYIYQNHFLRITEDGNLNQNSIWQGDVVLQLKA